MQDLQLEELYKNSNFRKNVIHWYPVKENSSVLQIGYDSIKIVEELYDKFEKVTICVNNEEDKKEILEKYSDSEITIIDNLDKIPEIEKYDYVTLIGTLEIYKDIVEEKAYKRLEKMLNIAKKVCKEDGKILLAVDNKYGMKFWTTMYAQKNILCNQTFAISKKMINELLEKLNLTNYKYYYMLPDYKMTNVIFTDNYLPNIESISRNFTYGEEDFATFNQTEAYGEILKEDTELFKLYANSYFVEISKQELVDNNIKFVSYTNIRRDKFSIQTTIFDDRVEKTYLTKKSKQHIENMKKNIDIMNESGIKTLDSYEKEKIISKFVTDTKTYDKILLEYLEKEDNEAFLEKIRDYKKFLIEKLGKINYNDIKENNIFTKYEVKIEENIANKFNFVKNGLWDMIFQNIFYIENEMYFYDQEWYDENVPVEYIIYRTIAYFANAHEYIKTEELYNKLELSEYINIFEELDAKIQLEIRNEKMWKLHNSTKTGQTLLDSYKNLQNEYDEYTKKIKIVKTEEILLENEKLKNENDNLKQINQKMLNSTSWKLTKPVRWLGKKIK